MNIVDCTVEAVLSLPPKMALKRVSESPLSGMEKKPTIVERVMSGASGLAFECLCLEGCPIPG